MTIDPRESLRQDKVEKCPEKNIEIFENPPIKTEESAKILEKF